VNLIGRWDLDDKAMTNVDNLTKANNFVLSLSTYFQGGLTRIINIKLNIIIHFSHLKIYFISSFHLQLYNFIYIDMANLWPLRGLIFFIVHHIMKTSFANSSCLTCS